MTEKTFCEECRNYVEYTTVSVPMTGRIKGKEYHYTGTEARCADCGGLVFVPEISDDNLRSLYNVFRERMILYGRRAEHKRGAAQRGK